MQSANGVGKRVDIGFKNELGTYVCIDVFIWRGRSSAGDCHRAVDFADDGG